VTAVSQLIRAIAGAVGVNEITVRRDLGGSTHVEPERVTGLDGKSYPARRASQKSPELPPHTRRHVGIRLSLTLTTSKRPGAVGAARGMANAYWEAITVKESTNQPPGEAEAYERFVKLGDAVETPDGGLWVVNDVAGENLAVISASRDATGQICVDGLDAVTTRLPSRFATKVADARAVHRE